MAAPKRFLTTKLRWEDLVVAVTQQQLHLLARSRPQQQVYNEWTQATLQEYRSVADYLFDSIFRFPTAADPASGKLRADTSVEYAGPRLIFRANDFPYFLEEGIDHHVLWCYGAALTDADLRHVLEKHRRGYDTLHFINPPGLQSVKEIQHAHIFSRLQPTATQQEAVATSDRQQP